MSLQLVYSGEVDRLVSGCTECLLRVWDAETGQQMVRVGPDGHGPGVQLTAACLDPSGCRLVTGAEDGSVKVWDLDSGQQLKERTAPGRGMTGKDDDDDDDDDDNDDDDGGGGVDDGGGDGEGGGGGEDDDDDDKPSRVIGIGFCELEGKQRCIVVVERSSITLLSVITQYL